MDMLYSLSRTFAPFYRPAADPFHAADAQGNINDTTVDDLSAAIKRADSLWKKGELE